MKNRIICLLVGGFLLLFLTTGCSKNSEVAKSTVIKEQDITEISDCIDTELQKKLLTDKDKLVEISLSDITKDNQDKIEYFKGGYASKHKDNRYIIVYPKNGTYDFYVMKDFDKYFYDKYSVYQLSDTPSSPTIYTHSENNDIDFEAILNKCIIKNDLGKYKSLSSSKIKKINKTEQIVIKSGDKEIGKIKDKDQIDEITKIITESKLYDGASTCDGHAFDFELYDKKGKLIDTIYVWRDGKRLLPKSINKGGCSSYNVSNDGDLRKIIEKDTDYIFYGLYDFRDDINEESETLIYKDDKNSYYLRSKNGNDILIVFHLNNKVMSVKYALENNYISATTVASDYEDILKVK